MEKGDVLYNWRFCRGYCKDTLLRSVLPSGKELADMRFIREVYRGSMA